MVDRINGKIPIGTYWILVFRIIYGWAEYYSVLQMSKRSKNLIIYGFVYLNMDAPTSFYKLHYTTEWVIITLIILKRLTLWKYFFSHNFKFKITWYIPYDFFIFIMLFFLLLTLYIYNSIFQSILQFYKNQIFYTVNL